MSDETLFQQLVGGEVWMDMVEITVPGTRDFNIPLTDKERQRVVDRTCGFLTDLFGGAVAIPAYGFYRSQSDQGLVAEPVTLVYSLTSGLSTVSIQAVIQYAKTLKRELGQESVLVRINGGAALV